MIVIKFPGNNCSLWTVAMLTIVLTMHGVFGRQIPAQKTQQEVLPAQQQQHTIIDDLLLPNKDTEQDAYTKTNQLHEPAVQHSTNTNKWPSLHDLLFTADYDDDVAAAPNMAEELLNSHFLERLTELADNTIDSEGLREQARYSNWDQYKIRPQAIVAGFQKPLAAVGTEGAVPRSAFKGHATKKNAYMSPCHFKICNMGRKRDAQYYSY